MSFSQFSTVFLQIIARPRRVRDTLPNFRAACALLPTQAESPTIHACTIAAALLCFLLSFIVIIYCLDMTPAALINCVLYLASLQLEHYRTPAVRSTDIPLLLHDFSFEVLVCRPGSILTGTVFSSSPTLPSLC